ncbi:Winged helix DNA-binding domain-containing protein [Cnuella takakiae]|uniref:Winged helix DNA-binding domain-containing protein n=1 Tax=Cnuella takakiae TaxID=1302690 RepID=A0A1M5FIF6_9BACT|nr:transcriptional regulator [Cnuella takakiae]OLY93765.1 transcriptional regulator [Cnuella takakiae]SHF90932.1 Winged helix DNA-binding domain-containing protein [Cnuella takakiae]
MNAKNPIAGLNKLFDNRIRLGVMSILRVNEEVSFNDLKGLLEVTDGNLATHLVSLEENGLIKVHKGFVGRKTNTTYTITPLGAQTFNDHIAALELLLKNSR